MNVKWRFENQSISTDQLKAITKDFRKVLPHVKGIKLRGIWEKQVNSDIEQQELFTCFRDDIVYSSESGDGFFFGVHNIDSGQNIDCYNDRYRDVVTAFLAIAKVHLQHDIHISVSGTMFTVTDTQRQFDEGVELCQNILGHAYDLLDITHNGKLRLKTWELETYGK